MTNKNVGPEIYYYGFRGLKMKKIGKNWLIFWDFRSFSRKNSYQGIFGDPHPIPGKFILVPNSHSRDLGMRIWDPPKIFFLYGTLTLQFNSWPKSDHPTLTFLRKINRICRTGGPPSFL